MSNYRNESRYTGNRCGSSRSERRIINNRIRRKKEMQKNFLLAFMTFCLVITFSFSINSFLSNAKGDDDASYKRYKSVAIAEGDTLWSLANEYMDSVHYDSIKDYIKEVKQMNALRSDTISYGEYIIVPYYTYED